MSTNKTENYVLHAWEPGDDFLLAEINENFARLDTATRVVTGTYTGAGTAQQTVSLGFSPKAVLVTSMRGEMNAYGYARGGLALPGHPAVHYLGGPEHNSVEITGEGFTVFYLSHTSYSVSTNGKNTVYYYLALR